MSLSIRSGAAAVALWSGLLYAGSGPAASDAGANPGSSDSLPVLPAPAPPAVPLNQTRILKLIPDYQTVEDGSGPVAPLTAREKWRLALKEAADPFNIGNAAFTAAFSQWGNETPRYGQGWDNYGRRFGAAIADFETQSIMSAAVFATILHQDPRYFRKGPGSGILPRVLYSASRVFVCRNDAGRSTFNASNFLGMGVGIAASNIYYPDTNRTAEVMAGRIETSLLGSVTGNLLSEFWPDIQRKVFHRKRH